MDFLLKESKLNTDRLTIEQKAAIGLLDNELSIDDIAALCCKNEREKRMYITSLIELCRSGKIEYYGDINGSNWKRYGNNPYPRINAHQIDMGDPMRTALYDLWKSKPTDCLISRNAFIKYLKNVNQWPVKTGLIMSWFGLRRKRKPVEKRRSGASESLMLIDEILDKMDIQYFDDLKEGEIWNLIVSGKVESDLIGELPSHSNSKLVMSGGEKITKKEFLKKYNDRFYSDK